MQKQVLTGWFFKSILIVTCVSILALDINKKKTFYSKIDLQKQSSSLQNQYGIYRWPRRLSNKHIELISRESMRKTPKILHDSPLLVEKVFNITHILTSHRIDKIKKESFFDDGLLLLPANNGKEKINSIKSSNYTSNDNEDKKTLSQQVKEGKYGLIQNEIYPVKPKRPGIISYLLNSEIPHDTIKSLGGLTEKEIWLAENHLLVLKGGNFPESNTTVDEFKNEWPAIDNYEAPRRQVKIPAKPKVPPPFPIQLIEGGPIQFINDNGTILIKNKTVDLEVFSGNFRGFLPGEGPYFSDLSNHDNNNINSRNLGSTTKNTKAYEEMFIYTPLEPGAGITTSPKKEFDYDDENQSVYYPPRYSFVYSQDNSTSIPPGPLVPGIILPPPPDFFSYLDEKETIFKDKYTKNRNTTSISAYKVSYLSPQKTITNFYKTPLTTVSSIKKKTVSYHSEPFTKRRLKNSTHQQTHSQKTIRDYPSIPFVEVTTYTPQESTTLNNSEKYDVQQIIENQINVNNITKIPWKTMITNNAMSFVTLFTSTTSAPIDKSFKMMTPLSIKNVLTTEKPIHYPSQTSFYYYEKDNNQESYTSTPIPLVYFSSTTEMPSYYNLKLSHQQQEQKQHSQLLQQQYAQQQEQKTQSQLSQQKHVQQHKEKEFYNDPVISPQHIKDYNIEFIDSIINEPPIYHYFNTGKINNEEKFKIPFVKEQNFQMLYPKPQHYQFLSTNSAPKWTFPTQKSEIYFQKPIIENLEYKQSSSKSKPIYQYSFEATNYAKSKAQTILYKPQISKHQNLHQQAYHSHKQSPLHSEYKNIQDIKNSHISNIVINNKQEQTQKVSYIKIKKNEQQSHSYHSTTLPPIHITTLPSYQHYFTKQDEQLLDDVTKEYFTVFGKKLSDNKLLGTTPLYSKLSATEKPEFNNNNYYKSKQYNRKEPPNTLTALNVKVRYGDQTSDACAIKGDDIVNYKHPLSLSTLTNNDFISLININPQSVAVTKKFKPQNVLLKNQIQEYTLSPVPNIQPKFHVQTYENDRLEKHQNFQGDKPNSFKPINNIREVIKESDYTERSISLQSDISVNYKNYRPQINPNAEFFNHEIPKDINTNINKANSYFTYTLPENNGHFYFITPQLIKREDSNREYLNL